MNTAAFALPLLYNAIQQFTKNLFAKDRHLAPNEKLPRKQEPANVKQWISTEYEPKIISIANCADKLYKPVRVVRVIETGQTRDDVGRMVISGRMADVCAELDRLASLEAA